MHGRSGEQVQERLKRPEEYGLDGILNPTEKPPPSKEPVYDDSGTGAYTGEIVNDKKKLSKMKAASGVEYAPWMTIDERKIEDAKKAREQRKN
jgi:hypothetical protein